MAGYRLVARCPVEFYQDEEFNPSDEVIPEPKDEEYTVRHNNRRSALENPHRISELAYKRWERHWKFKQS